MSNVKSFEDAFIHFISGWASEDLAELCLSNSKYIQLGLDIEVCSEEIISVVSKDTSDPPRTYPIN